MGGIVSARPLSALLEDENKAAAAAERATKAAQDTVISSLVDHIKRHWSLAKDAKEPVEREMLRAVRAKRGEYDPDKLAQIKKQGGSEIYMMLFATKARQLKALVNDTLIGTGGDKPWTLQPSPRPELPQNEVNQIMQGVYQMTADAEMMGLPLSVDDVRQRLMDQKVQLEQRVMEAARAEAERADIAIEDVMVEGGWLEALDAFIDDITTFKTAFMKGPVVRMVPQMTWGVGPDGNPVPQTTVKAKVTFERTDPLMIYPVPWARSVHDAPLIERHKLSRTALSALIGVDGYSEDAIRAALDKHGSGGLTEWLQIDADRDSAEGRDTVSQHKHSDLIDALQYWGSVSGKMLKEWGMTAEEVADEAKEYEVEAWLIGEWVIKAVINPDPLFRRPYYSDGFSRIAGAFWHNSLFDVISDCQDMCNGAARALSNNLGISSGPQVVVNVDRLPQGEEITELYPWKIHQVTSDPMGSSAAPITFFQPGSNANELMGVFERFSQLADEYSGIPRYMAGIGGGEGGAGRTASGMSMMVGNASKQVKQLLGSIDINVISKSVERTFQWLMQYQPELGLKGDLQVKARGALSLVTKESAQVRINEFLARTGNPIDLQIMGVEGRAELLRHAVKTLDLNTDKVVPAASTVKTKQLIEQQLQQQAMQQAQMAQQAMTGGKPPAQPQPGAPKGNGQALMNGAPQTDNFSPTPA